MAEQPTNPFPPRWIGLWRVKNEPYYYKERWPEAPFGDRWRQLKARIRGITTAPRTAVTP